MGGEDNYVYYTVEFWHNYKQKTIIWSEKNIVPQLHLYNSQ